MCAYADKHVPMISSSSLRVPAVVAAVEPCACWSCSVSSLRRMSLEVNSVKARASSPCNRDTCSTCDAHSLCAVQREGIHRERQIANNTHCGARTNRFRLQRSHQLIAFPQRMFGIVRMTCTRSLQLHHLVLKRAFPFLSVLCMYAFETG